MSSVGQGLGGIVGGVIGFMVGGPSGALYGAQVGMMVGGLLDPPKVEGPRLEDLSQQTSTYGVFIPRAYGTVALHGNVFWVQGDSLIERGVESGGKGGPEVTNYEYYASFAISLCEGPIDGVRRIWIGGQLWYDAGVTDLASIIASNERATGFTLYTGTETQEADPLIQADRGIANVPAYRGLAYIVFNELPLKDVGNTIAGAQVKVEVVKNATYSPTLVETHVVPANASWSLTRSCAGNQHDSSGFRNYVSGDSAGLQTYWIREIGGSEFATILSQDGSVISISTSLNDLHYAYVADNYQYVRWGSGGELYYYDCGLGNRCYTLGEGGGNVFFTVQPNTAATYYLKKLTRKVSGIVTAGGVQMEADYTVLLNTQVDFSCIAVWNGDAVVFNKLAGLTSYNLTIDIYSGEDLSLIDSYAVTITPADADGIDAQTASGHVYDDKLYIVYAITTTTAKIIVIDLIARALSGVYQPAASLSGLATPATPNIVAVGDLVFWGQRQTVDAFRSQVWSLNKFSSGPQAVLADIVDAECIKTSLLTTSDLDVTDLTDQVRGYRIGSLGPIRGGIDPLRKAWPFDVVQHGYQIKFKARGGASVATITEAELDAREAGSSPGVQVTNIREMDTILPDQLTTKYLDAAREYDINVAEQTR